MSSLSIDYGPIEVVFMPSRGDSFKVFPSEPGLTFEPGCWGWNFYPDGEIVHAFISFGRVSISNGADTTDVAKILPSMAVNNWGH